MRLFSLGLTIQVPIHIIYAVLVTILIDGIGETVVLSDLISPNVVILIVHRYLISYYMRISVDR